ncbi:uncharacterized protein LOC124555853 [Schistocerca americana]|uniref:uncharacterized protein LOC124555853 n=1 Tax=Schistocerca americana TaxID=7009 RepID=UPI001F503E67|nr:uncharacterized protein LOC124555853 [Schistocerca americana]
MEPSEKTKLVKQRGVAKAALARLASFVQSADSASIEMLESKLNRLTRIQTDFESSQSRLEIEDESADHSKDRAEFEDSWDFVESTLKGSMKRYTQIPQPLGSNPSGSVSSLKLPAINLPNFEGDYLKWSSYRDTFLSLIMNNNSIDDVQKLHYLNSSLRGEAKDLLKHIPVTAGNLAIAWGLITQRYNNPKIIAARHAKALLALPTVGHGAASDYRQLINHVCSHLKALEALKPDVPLHEVILSEEILSSMRPTDRHEWEVKMSGSTFTTLNQLIDFLETKCQALELIRFRDNTSRDLQGNVNNLNQTRHVRRAHLANADAEESCNFCSEPHTITKCKGFQALNVDERRAYVTKNKLCFLCIRSGHFSTKCRISPCKTCKGRHNILLHKPAEPRNGQSSEPGGHSLAHQTTNGKANTHCNVLLATAVVNIKDSMGRQQVCRVLLDSASQLSFISKGMAEKLKLKRSKHSFPVKGINNAFAASVSYTCDVELSSRVNDFRVRTTCAVVDHVTSDLPASKIDTRSWSVPCNLPLADPEFNKPATVDLILGAEVFFDIVCKERLVKPGHPSLVETKFGWILSGRMPSASCNMPRSTVTSCFVRGDNLDAKLQRFWELEELSTKTISKQGKICEAHFQRDMARDEEGRFVVRLPVKPDCKSLGEARQQASRRLAHLERRFKRQPNLQKEYAAFMHEYGNEIALLMDSSPIPYNSKLRDLHPFVDAEGILRVGGRLMNASVPYDERHPIIVPPMHHLTKFSL